MPRRHEKQFENDLDLVDILAALNRSADAERLLADDIQANPIGGRTDPTRRLRLLAKSASIAEREDDSRQARQRWLQVVAEGKTDLAATQNHGRNVKGFLDSRSNWRRRKWRPRIIPRQLR